MSRPAWGSHAATVGDWPGSNRPARRCERHRVAAAGYGGCSCWQTACCGPRLGQYEAHDEVRLDHVVCPQATRASAPPSARGDRRLTAEALTAELGGAVAWVPRAGAPTDMIRRSARCRLRLASWVAMNSSSSIRFPVTVRQLPVARCQICHQTVAHKPGQASAVLTDHYRQVHPDVLTAVQSAG
jgi:hypothetical protein